jgi:hypothetical protein
MSSVGIQSDVVVVLLMGAESWERHLMPSLAAFRAIPSGFNPAFARIDSGFIRTPILTSCHPSPKSVRVSKLHCYAHDPSNRHWTISDEVLGLQRRRQNSGQYLKMRAPWLSVSF